LNEITENRIPLTKIQKLIGRRMLESKQSKPCFYIEAKADVTEFMAIRPELKKSLGVKITTNVFYLYTLALASRKYPLMLGTIDGDNIKIADSINIGFAVNASHGLVVPVVKNADTKTLAQIAEIEKLLTDKARSNKLTLAELEGETIALSNLGAYGIDSFFGIVPPPTSTILAVGNVIQTPVPINNQIAVRKLVSLTLAVDHRVIDTHYAAAFLSFIVEKLQNPRQLI
jgi:pyruvate dehydrogenase E2 component (dihydrolipoamide acetyltransferase)